MTNQMQKMHIHKQLIKTANAPTSSHLLFPFSGHLKSTQLTAQNLQHPINEDIAEFLDSRYGRHFADDVFCNKGSLQSRIAQAITKWQNWTLGSLADGTGLPRHTPYLQGMLLIYKIV